LAPAREAVWVEILVENLCCGESVATSEADAGGCCDKRFRSDNADRNALPPPLSRELWVEAGDPVRLYRVEMYAPACAAARMAALLVIKRCAMSAEGRSPLVMTTRPLSARMASRRLRA
jgi:hypothetical protein